MSDTIDLTIDHDTWNYSPPKLAKASKIELDDIYGVLPFDGVRNPSGRSAISQKVFMTYSTPANNWQPKVGVGESAAEIAVAHEALICASIHDVHFQPLTVSYLGENGKPVSYTHDLLLTFSSGHQRLVFVRNGSSLLKPKTKRDIQSIVAATPKGIADDLIVVDADTYTRQRRDNLFRMHDLVFRPDPEADDIVWHAAQRHRSLYYMRDLFSNVPLAQSRVFESCYRLVARQKLHANLDHVLWEHSHIQVAA